MPSFSGPDVGTVSTEENPEITDSHQVEVDASLESNWILGSHMSLIMQKDVPVTFLAGDGSTDPSPVRAGAEIASTSTNGMGAYEYELLSADIPEGTKEIVVVAKNAAIRTIAVTEGTGSPEEPTSGAFHKTLAAKVIASVFMIAALF